MQPSRDNYGQSITLGGTGYAARYAKKHRYCAIFEDEDERNLKNVFLCDSARLYLYR